MAILTSRSLGKVEVAPGEFWNAYQVGIGTYYYNGHRYAFLGGLVLTEDPIRPLEVIYDYLSDLEAIHASLKIEPRFYWLRELFKTEQVT